MKLNKMVLALGMALAAGAVNAASGGGSTTTPDPVVDQGHGQINFVGSIVDAPCSITSETADQTVDLGQISSVALTAKQNSSPKHFEIDLKDCNIADESVKVTFSGPADVKDNSLLALSGNASGAGIAIVDSAGQPVALGTPTTAQKLADGPNTLNFTAYMKADGASVVAGEFSSTANFTLDYK